MALLLALCLTACLPSALAEEYAEPNAADGWVYKENSDEWWLINKEVSYTLPFSSNKGIYLNESASLTAPSIKVEGKVETSGNGRINCAGLLSATGEVNVNGNGITVGSLECGEIHVGSYLVVRDRISCAGKMVVNGMLVLPGNTTEDEVRDLKATGDGLILVGTKAYDTNGDLRKGASIYLTDGIDVSDDGFGWNSGTCTLTLNDFTRNYVSENISTAGIFISAPGKPVTLVLNGENNLTGPESMDYGIAVQEASLTLTGGGSLNCSKSYAALFILGGSLQLAEGCTLQDNKEVFNAPSMGAYIMESNGQAFATSFSLEMKKYSVTVTTDGNGTAMANPASAAKGDTVTLTATPNPGYVFDRWEVSPATVTIGSDGTFTMPGSAVEIKAYFKQAEYTVTLDANGGAVTPASVTTVNGGILPGNIPNPVREGYAFQGWYTERDGGYQAIPGGSRFSVDVTLYAHWKAADYKVTLNTNGGTVNGGNVTGYVYGKGAKLPTDVTREGYTFGGWYDNEALSGSRVTVITGTDTGDKTYWAKWTASGSAPPQTGDGSHTGLWLSMMLLSLGGLAALGLARRRSMR